MGFIYILNQLRQENFNNTYGIDPILDGLLGAWDFETNPTVLDLTGSIDGTVISGSLAAGANGNGIGVSSSVDAWIDFGNPSAYHSLDEITVFIDFYPTAVGESGVSLIFGTPYTETGGYAWNLGWNSSGQVRGRINNTIATNYTIVSTNTYSLNTWHRLALRWAGNGTPVDIFIDGVDEYNSGNVSGSMRTSILGMMASLDLSYSGASTRQISGRLDNAFVWNRGLSDTEVTQMFTGNPTFADLYNTAPVQNPPNQPADPAQDFIDAVGTLTAGEQTAIINLVDGLQTNGTWDKYKVIYPFIGGTAAEHKWNLKDPRDLDVAYRLTFTGSWTHNESGSKGDGSTAWAQTWFYESASLVDAGASIDFMVGYYSNLDVTGSNSTNTEIGANTGTTPTRAYMQVNDGSGIFARVHHSTAMNAAGTVTNAKHAQVNSVSASVYAWENGIKDTGSLITQTAAAFTLNPY